MSEPEKRTAAATAKVIRRGDDTAAARLHAHGWIVIPPERVAELPADLIDQIRDGRR